MKLWEWLAMAAILGVGAWLRFSNLDLLEFKGDEAIALHLAYRLVHGTEVPLAGLMSSVGVTNPPLFIYLLIPMVAISSNPAFVSCCIAVLGLTAVAVCWHIGRKYYGAVTGLVGAAMFAVSPWAVIYSRKIWSLDFVPVINACALWAVHALVIDKKPKAVFGVLLLPLCVIQIHFSGLALTATVLVILLVSRPKIDWGFAAAGVALATLIALPYLKFQTENDWADFRKAVAIVSGQEHHISSGMRLDPNTGGPLPQRDCYRQAIAIVDAGRMEDLLGLSTRRELDPQGIWPLIHGKQAQYFDETARWSLRGLWFQQGLLMGALILLALFTWRGLKGWTRFPFIAVADDPRSQGAWLLLCWMVGPLLVFAATRLWTSASYFVILYPSPFLALGLLADCGWRATGRWGRSWKAVVIAALAIVVMADLVFWKEFTRFLRSNGGAHGSYGTVLSYKQSAAHYLASHVDVPNLMQTGRLMQMDQVGKFMRGRMDVVLLALLAGDNEQTSRPTNVTVIVVDENRTNFGGDAYNRWLSSHGDEIEAGRMNFGPLQLHFLHRPMELQWKSHWD
ncbi:MAG: hypothetical protein ABSC38_04590 [Verrucomicrobiia bacterium]